MIKTTFGCTSFRLFAMTLLLSACTAATPKTSDVAGDNVAGDNVAVDVLAVNHFAVVEPAADEALVAMQRLPTVTELPFSKDIEPHATIIEASHPFASMLCSVGKVNLAEHGYTEKEYLQSGTANVYDLNAEQRAIVDSAGHDYTTRLLVRYPTAPKKFSGRVYIDILNASAGLDMEDLWRRSWRYLMNGGHAYVGITSKDVTAKALQQFNSRRYAALDWQANGDDENGLFWDMLSQLGTLLRQPDAGGVLGPLEAKHVYLAGQSQSGAVLNTYLSAFVGRLEIAAPNNTPLFDAYLNLVGPMVMPIASEGLVSTEMYTPSSVPLIVIMSEGEHAWEHLPRNPNFPPTPAYQRVEDLTEPSRKLRFYEVAGTPHADLSSPILPNVAELKKAFPLTSSEPLTYNQGHVETNLNIDSLVNSALENMHTWASEGIPAPAADAYWIKYSADKDETGNAWHKPLRDELGNTKGGVRLPLIEAPLYRFFAFRNDANFDISGSMKRLDRQTLNTLYPNGSSDYLKQFSASTDKLLALRYLLQEDADELKAWAAQQSF